MTTSLQNIWNDRSPRERIMLGILAFLLCGSMLWLLVLRPIAAARAAAAESRNEAVQSLGETRFYARAIARLRTSRPAVRRSAQTLAATAGAVGLNPGRAEDLDGAIRLTFDDAPPKALLGWIAGVETQGMPVRSLNVVPNGAAGVRAVVVFRLLAD